MLVFYVGLCAVLLCGSTTAVTDAEFKELKADVLKMQETQKAVVTSLARQVSQQQLYVEEMTRSYGDSGLKMTRLTRTGSKAYFSTSFSGSRIASIHEHSNYRGTVGMGELVAVLNGVEFRTRHNDYKMRMPSTTSSSYGATEDVPYPEVPSEVLAQPTVDLQIEEMREWFKAWQSGDYSKRDYRKYFKANLCYLEGMWTNADSGTIDEPFLSERHSIDASSFFDLQSKIRYTSVTGRKSTKENYAYLPTTINEVDDHGNIIYSQWNYKILCHPLKTDVPVARLKLEDDLAVRVANGKPLGGFATQRSARFSLYPNLKKLSKSDIFVKTTTGSFLDSLMEEIPGKNNYPAKIVDNFNGDIAYPKDALLPRFPDASTTLPEPLNVGFYHNAYKVIGNDAMGVSVRRRGFSDNSLYVAYNTHPKVAAVKVKGKCKRAQCQRINKKRICQKPVCPAETVHRVSYAIPLELIYTTPLQTWNPYNLQMFPSKNGPLTTNVTAGLRRSGGATPQTAYAGVSSGYYYLTPTEFFEDKKGGKKDKADTTRKRGVGVLDSAGSVRSVLASGISIMTKYIPGVGSPRIRYPIMPLHIAGSTGYKDIQALSDLTLKQAKYHSLYPGAKDDNGTIEETFTFEVSMARRDPPGPHIHTLELVKSEIDDLKNGKIVTVSTSEVAGHDHEIILRWHKNRKYIYIDTCDGDKKRCWDGHNGKIVCPDCRFGI